jgi:hypothetical protein
MRRLLLSLVRIQVKKNQDVLVVNGTKRGTWHLFLEQKSIGVNKRLELIRESGLSPELFQDWISIGNLDIGYGLIGVFDNTNYHDDWWMGRGLLFETFFPHTVFHYKAGIFSNRVGVIEESANAIVVKHQVQAKHIVGIQLEFNKNKTSCSL